MSSSRHPEPAKNKKEYGFQFIFFQFWLTWCHWQFDRENQCLHYNPCPVHVIQNLQKVKKTGLQFIFFNFDWLGVFVNLTEKINALLHYNPCPVHVIQNLQKVKKTGLQFIFFNFDWLGVFINLTEKINALLHYNPCPVHVIQNLQKVKKNMVSNLFFSILFGSVSLAIWQRKSMSFYTTINAWFTS